MHIESFVRGRWYKRKHHVYKYPFAFTIAIVFSRYVFSSNESVGSTRKGSRGTRSIGRDWERVIKDFMDTAPRESYSVSTIEAAYKNNEGNLQNTSILVRISHGNISFVEAFDRNRHSRRPSVIHVINKIFREDTKYISILPKKITFLVCVSDGSNPSVAIFGAARHWRNWKSLIPVPIGNDRGLRHGWGSSMEAWDKYIEKGIVASRSNYSWDKKIPRAMFRGNLRMQTHKLGTCNFKNKHKCTPATSWEQVNRGRMFIESRKRPQLFDIGFMKNLGGESFSSNVFDGAPSSATEIPFFDYQNYKLLINVGSNADWAERMRMLMLTNSAVVKHEAETQEFFYPLLKSWKHYIPTNLLFSDLVKNVQWALNNDKITRKISLDANEFARKYLSEYAMEMYWEIALHEFALRQRQTYTDN